MARGIEIVAAIAQEPFWSSENQFATLKPIAVFGPEQMERVRLGDYPNRDLCWWMIRGISQQREILPGRLVVGRVEEADQFDAEDPDKDKFQLAWDSVKLAGPKNIIEVILGPDNLGPHDLINGECILSLDHSPTSLVLVRLGDKVYGPFKTEYERSGSGFNLSFAKPQSSEHTIVWDAERIWNDPGFAAIKGVEISADAKALNRSSQHIWLDYCLLTWNRFEALQHDPLERIRLFTDEEIVRHAAKQVLARKGVPGFMKVWSEIRSVYLAPQGPVESTEAADILKALDAQLVAQSKAIDDLVQSMLESGILDDRIKAAIEARTVEYIDTNTTNVRAKIEEQITGLRQQEEELTRRVQTAENDFERKRRLAVSTLDDELNASRRDFDQWIAAEKSSIAHERAEVDTRRRVLEEGLTDVATRFVEHREELVKDFLALSPFLSQLGVLTMAPHGSPPEPRVAQSAPVNATRPLFLETLGGSPGLESEAMFFERFQEHVENSGFRFKRMDLVAFHLSVKCGDLTILGGLSGTGKSSLPLLYAQALAGDEQRFRAVDVSPAWLEQGDLLGRANLLEGRFQPASTGLFEHLVWAATEANRVGKDSGIWIACLDEMNLAQPEHYFSGFLQALARTGSQRFVGVFSPSSVREDDLWKDSYRILLGNNLRFVGTVNYDETTKPLSQRLRDRANELRLETVPFGSLQGSTSTAVGGPKGPPITVGNFDAWTRDTTLTGQAASVIDAIQQPLAVLGSPLTPRRYRAITRFVASARDLCSAEEAFDLQLKQRVLNQLRGLFRPEARRALDELRTILADHGTSFLGALQMLDRIYSENSQDIDFETYEAEEA